MSGSHEHQRRGRSRARRAFTLLEAILALTLMIMLLSGVFGFYKTTLEAREAGREIARDAMLAHSILERIGDEIRHTTDIMPGDGIGFGGTHDKITIIRATMPERYAFDEHGPHDQLPPGQLDIRRITYELIWDEELKDDEDVKICHGLLRSEQRTFDPNPKFVIKTTEETDLGGKEDKSKDPVARAAMPVDRELIAPEVKYVRFEYYDGAEWRDRWQTTAEQMGEAGGEGDHALPQAVKVTIGRERVAPEDEEQIIAELSKMDERQKRSQYHPDRFTLIIYLLQADQSLLSSRKYGVKNNTSLQMGGE